MVKDQVWGSFEHKILRDSPRCMLGKSTLDPVHGGAHAQYKVLTVAWLHPSSPGQSLWTCSCPTENTLNAFPPRSVQFCSWMVVRLFANNNLLRAHFYVLYPNIKLFFKKNNNFNLLAWLLFGKVSCSEAQCGSCWGKKRALLVPVQGVRSWLQLLSEPGSAAGPGGKQNLEKREQEFWKEGKMEPENSRWTWICLC